MLDPVKPFDIWYTYEPLSNEGLMLCAKNTILSIYVVVSTLYVYTGIHGEPFVYVGAIPEPTPTLINEAPVSNMWLYIYVPEFKGATNNVGNTHLFVV